MVLLVKQAGNAGAKGEAVDTLADFGELLRQKIGAGAAIAGLPGAAGVVGAKNAGGGDGHVHAA